MGDNWTTFGHKAVKAVLEKQLGSGKVPHTYLFLGPKSVGKKTLALELAKKLLKTDRLDIHPDFYSIEKGDEAILIEDALNFVAKATLKPFAGKYKFSLIDNAQNLNLHSSNALLKTLEEASDSNIIVLISCQNILPTIMSRCQVLHFDRLSQAEMVEFSDMQGKGLNNGFLELGFGSPGRLIRLARDKDFLTVQTQASEEWENLKSASLTKRLARVAEYSEKENQELSDVFECWMNLSVASLADRPSSYETINQLVYVLNGLKINLNKKLLLQKLFINL